MKKESSTAYQIQTALTINVQEELGLKPSIVINVLSKLSNSQNTNTLILSLTDLQNLTGLTKKEVRNAIKHLQDKKYITCSKSSITINISTDINAKLSNNNSTHYEIDHAKLYGVKAAILFSYIKRRIQSSLLKDTSTAYFYNWVWCFNTHEELSQQTFLTSKEIKSAVKILTEAQQIIKRRSGSHGRTHFTIPNLMTLCNGINDSKIISAISKHNLTRLPDFEEQRSKAIEKNEHKELLETIKAEMFKEQINTPIKPKKDIIMKATEEDKIKVTETHITENNDNKKVIFNDTKIDDNFLNNLDLDFDVTTKHNNTYKVDIKISDKKTTIFEEDSEPVKSKPFLLDYWKNDVPVNDNKVTTPIKNKSFLLSSWNDEFSSKSELGFSLN